MSVIEFNNFSFKYYAQKNPTLKNINLKIEQGEKVLIAGLSGSGKSTLGNCINGLIPFVYSGEIEGECLINGKKSSDLSLSELSKSVGTVLQDSDGQFVGLTVGEDIAFAMENDCINLDTMHQRVDEIATKLEITNLLKKAPGELSGGQKQRVSLAGVMVDDVSILLFDEPLANLDPATGKNTIELIDEIAKKTNATIIIIEHRIEDVLYKNVDRIVLFDNGRIIADEKPHTLLADNLLTKTGIREPLYLSALKLAGIKIKEENKPAYIDELVVDENMAKQFKNWVINNNYQNNETNSPLLELKNITFSYEGIINNVDDVSFVVNKGEMLAIVGKNGAGKSTILKLLTGFERLDSGAIYLNGRDLKDDTIFERGQKIGAVLQNPNQMICNTNIYDEIAYGLTNMGINKEEIKNRVEEAMKICGLYEYRNWPISALSYGQKKRVTIASILVMKPEVLILDEPTAGQDYRHYSEIMDFLKQLNQTGMTIIIITHDMHLMLEYCNHCVVISDGKKLYDGSCADVLNQEDIVNGANLKKTSLFYLAEKFNLDPKDVTLSYINAERGERNEK